MTNEILYDLASQVAEISSKQFESKVNEWKAFNTFNGERPMVLIDQLPWHELNPNTDMKLQTEGELENSLEWYFRRMIYSYNNFPVDMLVLPFLEVPKSAKGGLYFPVSEDVSKIDELNTGCISHAYHNQIKSKEDLEILFEQRTPIEYLEKETLERKANIDELLGGALPTKIVGSSYPWFDIWDTLPQIYGVENCISDLIDNPDFMHMILRRFTDFKMESLTEVENAGLLVSGQSYIHCSGAYTDELTTYDYPAVAEAKHIWGAGLAQIFSTVSPSMHKEFELDYAKEYYERCGLVYYGCCDPLHLKVDIICDAIPNVKKISMSPWVDQEIGAERLAERKVIMSRKPNPALLIDGAWDEEFIAEDLRKTKQACERYGCQLEYILKDVSTLNYHPERLYKWAEIAMKVANE